MEASTSIYLPTCSKDKQDKEHVKPVLYPAVFLKNKLVKDWEDNGKEVRDRCAIFTGEVNDRMIVIAMSKDDLVAKLTKLKVITVVE